MNAVIVACVFIYKTGRPPYVPYIHLLVDYHFGFMRRALIGAGVGLFVDKVPVWLVFAIGGAIWIVTAALFVAVFRRAFGLSRQTIPLLVFTAASPFFLKNFIQTLGHFDIYGCAVALLLLLTPAGLLGYIALAGVMSMMLVLIHHIQLLMYVPTIILIVALRHTALRGVTYGGLVLGVVALLGVSALFFSAQFAGGVPAPKEQFVAYLQTRMADPSQVQLLQQADIWYNTLPKEIAETWALMPWNLLGVPVYVILLAIHFPLWQYFWRQLQGLTCPLHRRLIIAGLAVVSLAYLVIFAIVFDYSRWISSWVSCVILIFLLTALLPRKASVPFDPNGSLANGILGWMVTIVPRVGIIRPF